MNLSKTDFIANLPFSTQIEDAQIRPFIANAYILDLLPLLGHETLERLVSIGEPVYTDYVGPVALPGFVLGQIVRRRERLYQALVAAPTNEPPLLPTTVTLYVAGYPIAPVPEAGGQWLFLRLETLYTQYLKTYWMQAAYVRFLANHGVNVTKAGLTVPIDRAQGTYDRPSANQVASLLADARVTSEAWLSRLTRFLKYNGLLYFYDAETGGGGYGTNGYEHVPGDPDSSDPHDRAEMNRRARRHNSPLRGI